MKQSKLLKKDDNKPSQGTNKPVVRDSNWSSVSALTRLIKGLCSAGPASSVPPHVANAPRGPLQNCHPLMYILALTILVTSFFFINNVSATGGSMTVTISDTTVDLNVSPSTNGTFAKSDATTIGVSTTNATGYTLSLTAQAGSNPTSLINGTDNTKMFPSIQSAITEDQFKALDGGTAYNNMWGYLPSKYCTTNNSNSNNGISNNSLNCSTNTNFLPSPTTNGDILDITSEANNTVNEYEITVGARVDTTATLGAYSNVFVVDVVANMIPYSITYYDNVVGAMPTDLTGETQDATVTISSNVPTRTGYSFIAWCTVAPTLNANGTDTCSGTQVAAGGTLNIDQTGDNNNFQLYAMWSGNYTMASVTYMQDFNTISADKKAKIISSMVEGQRYELKDNRDNELYYIAKLKDGNVWMLDNLRLGSGNTIALNPSNTNILKDFTLPASITGNFNGVYTAARVNAAYRNQTVTNYGQGSGKTGTYYNYCAASGGTYCYESNAGIDIANTLIDSPQDICPAGWRMPTGGTNGEYATLSATYPSGSATSQSSLQYNLSTALSGFYYNSAPSNRNQNNFSWASTYYTTSGMLRINATPSGIELTAYSNRDNGLTIRCLLR